MHLFKIYPLHTQQKNSINKEKIIHLVDQYGPTEATVHSNFINHGEKKHKLSNNSIGRPISNTAINIITSSHKKTKKQK